MSLKSTSLPKKYRDGKVLYEQSLDLWRQETERALATINLNFTQLRKDCFLSNYDYDNDGNANLAESLQALINKIASGDISIVSTTSDYFIINSDGHSSTLSTDLLTASRTHNLPNSSGTLVADVATQTLTNKTISTSSILNTRFQHPQQVTAVDVLVTTGKHTVLCTAAGVTITLTTAIAALDGYRVTVKDTTSGAGASPITIDTEGAETIDGVNSVQITEDNGHLTFEAYNGNFYIVN